MLDRTDVERIIKNVIAGLTIKVENSAKENSRDIVLFLGNVEISRTTIDISTAATFQ